MISFIREYVSSVSIKAIKVTKPLGIKYRVALESNPEKSTAVNVEMFDIVGNQILRNKEGPTPKKS